MATSDIRARLRDRLRALQPETAPVPAEAAPEVGSPQTLRERLRARLSAAQADRQVEPESPAQGSPASGTPPPQRERSGTQSLGPEAAPVDLTRVRDRLVAKRAPAEEWQEALRPEAPAPQIPTEPVTPFADRLTGVPFTAAEADVMGGFADMLATKEGTELAAKMHLERTGTAAERSEKRDFNTMAALKALSPAMFPAHVAQAYLMGEPERIKQAATMDLRWGTPAGEAALATWPNPVEIARKTRAHFRAVNKHLEVEAGRGTPFGEALAGGLKVSKEAKDEEYHKVVAEETAEMFRVNVGTDPHRSIQENNKAYLEAGGDPEVVARVQEMNKSVDWRPEENGEDWVITQGLPYVGLAVGLEFVDPLLPITAIAAKMARPLTEMDHLRRMGLLPAIAKSRSTRKMLNDNLAALDDRPLAGLVAAEKKIAAAKDAGIDYDVAAQTEKLLNAERAVVTQARTRVEDELGTLGFATPGSTIFRFSDEGPERIIGAAVRLGDDIAVGPSHEMALNEAETMFPGAMDRFTEAADAAAAGADAPPMDGFITSRGNFWTRDEAAAAIEANPEARFQRTDEVLAGIVTPERGITAITEKTAMDFADVDVMELTDWAMAGARTDATTAQYIKAVGKKLMDTYAGAPEGWAMERAAAIEQATAPLRALRTYLTEDQALRAAQSVPARRRLLSQKLSEVGAHIDALEEEAIDTMGKLVGGEIDVDDVRHVLHNGHMQRFLDGFSTPTRDEARTLKALTGHEWDGIGWSKEGMGWMGHNLEPRDALGGTGVWEAVRDGERAAKKWMRGWGHRFSQQFGDLSVGSDLDRKLGKALDAQVVGATDDGGLRLRYQLVDEDTGKAVRSEVILLDAEERAVYTTARAMFDELADEATNAGLKGFEHGKPVVQDYFPRIYDFGKTRTEVLREIPTDILDHVDSRVYFRHLQGRKFANRTADQQDPLFTEGLKLYLMGMGRKLHMEPALEAGEQIARGLDKTKQSYWGDWKRLLKGQRVREGRSLDAWVNRATEAVRQRTGVTALPHNPLTKSTLAMGRMFIRGILGMSTGSMITNLGQSINTATKAGLLDTLQGFMYARSKAGKALTKELGLTDDFMAVLEKDFPGHSKLPERFRHSVDNLNRKLLQASDGSIETLDDLIMSPMLYAENTNRGIALWTGITGAMKRRGLKPSVDLETLPVKVREEILHEALNLVEETQFIYGVMGTAPRFSGPAGRTLMTLSSFGPKQASFLIKQMKQDPTGIARFFAMSGFATRLSREAMGIDTEHIWGFGFVPPEFDTFPFTSPQVQLAYQLWRYGQNNPDKGGDPFVRQDALMQFTRTVGMLIPAPLGVAEEAIPLGLRNTFPALNQDIGSRAFRNTSRLLREASDGIVRGRNENMLRTQGTQEQLIRAFGMQPESARRFSSLVTDIRAPEREDALQRVNLTQRVSAMFENGQDAEAMTLIATEFNKGNIPRHEMFRLGGLRHGIQKGIQGTNVELLDRELMRNPAAVMDPGVHFEERAAQFRK